MKFLRKNLLSECRDIGIGPLSFTEKVIYWVIVLTPVWWLLGIQPLFYPIVAVLLLLANFRVEKLARCPIPLCVWAWLAMAITSLWTAALGLHEMNAGLSTIAAAMVTFLKGYLMIFSCLALPFFSRIRVQIVTRAVVLMSIGFLVNIVLQMMLLAVGISSNRYQPIEPILARVLPGDVSGSLKIILPSISSFFGVPLPRTVLHTADPPILGCCALLCFLISLSETDERLRNLSLFSSFSALIISFSRSSWLGFFCAMLVVVCLQYRNLIQVPLWLSSSVFFACSILGMSIRQVLEKPQEFFDSARSESSKERAIVVGSTIKAWMEKPLLGWGVIRGKAWLYDNEYLTLGSFSTYAAVLYLNGIVGFCVFIVSLLMTLIDFFQAAFFKHDFHCQLAFAGYLVLIALIYATPLSWMAIYLWFFFVWSGAALRDAVSSSDAEAILNWKQLI